MVIDVLVPKGTMKRLPQRTDHCKWMTRLQTKRRQFTLPNTQPSGQKYGWRIFPEIIICPNVDAYPSEAIREPVAEMLGTMILILVGTGVNCQFALSADADLSPSAKGSYLGFNIAWGCGLW